MNIHDIEDYVDDREQHQSYITLMNDYSGTEILKEAILFMDSAFPEWKTNHGVGSWAGEFMLTCIESLRYLQDETDYSSADVLKVIYAQLVYCYQKSQAGYSFAILDRISSEFKIINEDFDYDNRHLSEEDFMVLYSIKLHDFHIEYLKKVTYDFDFQ
ncbi:MAG: hypothetical protein WAV86_06710 [Lutibacter sp.]